MAWSKSRPKGNGTDAIYQAPAYRAACKRARDQLDRDGSGTCAEKVCKYPSRLIVPGMKLDMCHDRPTGALLGLGHRACNQSEAARYARSKQQPPPYGPRSL